ncbi:MAG: DUF305 domain-containing protein [Solirubrobacteraceae bacterium]
MSTSRTRLIVTALSALLALVGVVVLAGCGGDGDGDTASSPGTDRAFTSDMIPHHKSAVIMANTAKERSKRPEIQKLADEIIRAQDSEIAQMQAIDKRLADAGKKRGKLGGGAMMGMGNEASLETAEPFDRAFIDMMIPHHQSAVEMSRIEIAKGTDDETKKLATAIITAQEIEIKQMNAYRKAWFGSVSPSGGVPAEK